MDNLIGGQRHSVGCVRLQRVDGGAVAGRVMAPNRTTAAVWRAGTCCKEENISAAATLVLSAGYLPSSIYYEAIPIREYAVRDELDDGPSAVFLRSS